MLLLNHLPRVIPSVEDTQQSRLEGAGEIKYQCERKPGGPLGWRFSIGLSTYLVKTSCMNSQHNASDTGRITKEKNRTTSQNSNNAKRNGHIDC